MNNALNKMVILATTTAGVTVALGWITKIACSCLPIKLRPKRFCLFDSSFSESRCAIQQGTINTKKDSWSCGELYYVCYDSTLCDEAVGDEAQIATRVFDQGRLNKTTNITMPLF